MTDLIPDEDHFDWPPYENLCAPVDPTDTPSPTTPIPLPAPDLPDAARVASPPISPTTARGAHPSVAPSTQITPATPAPPPPTHLPDLGPPQATPGFMSRSALFGVGRPGHGHPHAGPLKSNKIYKLAFFGERLSMADKGVWERVVARAREERVDASLPFAVSLSELSPGRPGRNRDDRELARIWASLQRLASAEVEVEFSGAFRRGRLLASADRSKGATTVSLDASFALAALSEDIQFRLDSARRDGLASNLARWLHDFLSTHEQFGEPFDLRYLREMCGWTARPRAFPEALREALAELAASCPSLVASWDIDESKGGRGKRRKSDLWELAIERGPEGPRRAYAPGYRPPAPREKRPAVQPATTPRRRGGVAL